MDTTEALLHIVELLKEQMRGQRHIARRQEKLILLMERNQTGAFRVFLLMTWNAFYERLATNLGHWAAGLPLWLLAFEILGLRQLLEKLAGSSM